MDEYYEELCPFCERTIFLTYICQDCSAVFCGNCLKEKISEELVCSNCGNNQLERNKVGKFFCKVCNSENIISVKKTIYTCPNCGEPKVIKISEKFNEIKDYFKDIIIKTKKFTEPLSIIIKQLLELRERLVRLRLNKPKIYHFPEFESEFLQLIKLFNNLKEAANKKTIDFYDDINRNLEYYANLHSLPPKSIPILDGLNDNFKKNKDEIQQFLDESIKKIEPKISALTLKVNFMETIQIMFISYKEDLNLEENEKPVFGLRCKLDTGSNNENEYHSKNGVILLTNKRMYFIHEKGMIKRKSALLFSVLLEDLQTVQVEGAFTKKLSLEFVNSMYKFKISKENRDQLIDFIEKARIFDSNKIDETSLEAIREIEISIKNYQDALEEAIYTIVSFCNNEYYTTQGISKFDNILDKNTLKIRNPNISVRKNVYNRPNIDENKSFLYNNETKIIPNINKFPNLNKWFNGSSIQPNEFGKNNSFINSLEDTQDIIYNNQNQHQINLSGFAPNSQIQNQSFNEINSDIYNAYKNRLAPNFFEINPISIPTIPYSTNMPTFFYPLNYPFNCFDSYNIQARPINFQPIWNVNQNDSNLITNNYPYIQNNQIRNPPKIQYSTIPPIHQNYIQDQYSYTHNYINPDKMPLINPKSEINPFLNQNLNDIQKDIINNGVNHEYKNPIKTINNKINQQEELYDKLNQIRNPQYSEISNINKQTITNLNSTSQKSFDDLDGNSNFCHKDYNKIMNMFPTLKKSTYLPFSKNIQKINTPESSINKMENLQTISKTILELEKKKFSLNRTIEQLNNQLKQGILSENEYIQHYQNIQEELYLIEKDLAKLKI